MVYDLKYLVYVNDVVMCVVMIEIVEGFVNVVEIVVLVGVDVLFVGLVDLSFLLIGSIVGLGSQEFFDVLDWVFEVGKVVDVFVGMFGFNFDNVV